MLTLPARYGRLGALITPVALIVFIIHFLSASFGSDDSLTGPGAKLEAELETGYSPHEPPCPPLPGIEDILVVVKTGITEAQEKVPVHFHTTLRCIPHRIIVSDYEEEIAGERTRDVLRRVDPKLREANEDFALYNRVQTHGGRSGLISQDMNKVANGATGMSGNPGWKLDKWKFLPMIHEAAEFRPNASWYVFLEADTYPIWRNLLAWLEPMDPEQALYLGNQMQIQNIIFAHGGSGFVLSQAAMRQLVDFHAPRQDEWDRFTEEQWAGDCVLGEVLNKAGIQMTWSWPHVTTGSLWEADAFSHNYQRDVWCSPAVTFHHMNPTDIERMWEFDQEWFANETHSPLLYSDVFRSLIRPSLNSYRDNWDNLAEDKPAHRDHDISAPTVPVSPADCEEYCARLPHCMQYRVDDRGRCTTSRGPIRGKPKSGLRSGWLLDKVDAHVEELGYCNIADWVRP
ncbi:hypothetical protein N7474_007874 [Penicillium riverlandense]|uniref:uncharacterized protein n=1 Tax=Penicillium riverlandense TaxID=1903569 RepID=UPI0025471604|nr:uncharacterized protein N7474_007874 [Penicillium riverlandense]KAJ5811573.1 hypothetical protein N7474_007874 [Penicillium riverlandense]